MIVSLSKILDLVFFFFMIFYHCSSKVLVKLTALDAKLESHEFYGFQFMQCEANSWQYEENKYWCCASQDKARSSDKKAIKLLKDLPPKMSDKISYWHQLMLWRKLWFSSWFTFLSLIRYFLNCPKLCVI